MQKDQWHKLSRLTIFVMALPLALQVASAQVFAAHPRVAKNFFLEPNSSSQPCFTGTPLSQAELENRRIPDIRLLRSLPSLESESRKQIDRLYKKWQQETAELRNAIQSVQQEITKLNDTAAMSSEVVALHPVGKLTQPSELSGSATADVSQKFEASRSRTTAAAIIRSTDDTPISNSQNLPEKGSKVEDGSLESLALGEGLGGASESSKSVRAATFFVAAASGPAGAIGSSATARSADVSNISSISTTASRSLAELRKEQKKLRTELLTKRKELWSAIRPLLTEQNQADLEKMRH